MYLTSGILGFFVIVAVVEGVFNVGGKVYQFIQRKRHQRSVQRQQRSIQRWLMVAGRGRSYRTRASGTGTSPPS